MSKIQFSNGKIVEFDGNPTQQDVEEVAKTLGISSENQVPEQPGFVQGAVQSLAGTLLRPAANVAGIVGEGAILGLAGYEKFKGNEQGTQEYLNLAGQYGEKLKEGVDLGYFGKVKPVGADVSSVGEIFTKGLPDIVGQGAFTAANFAPGLGGEISLAKATFGQAVRKMASNFMKTGALAGGVSGFGQGLQQENATPTSVALNTLAGTAIGGATGGAIGGGGTAVVKGLQVAAKPVSRFVTAQWFGLNPKTISNVLKDPEAVLSAMSEQPTRYDVAQSVGNAIDDKLDTFYETGSQYNPIREAKTPVKIESGIVSNVLDKHGIDLIQKEGGGYVIHTSENTDIPMEQGDMSALENFLNNFGDGEKITNSSQVLNARRALDAMSNWGSTKSEASKIIAKEIRHEIDTIAKDQVPGLQALDEKMSPQFQWLKNFRKEFIQKGADGTWELKPGALTKIINAANTGKLGAEKVVLGGTAGTVEKSLNKGTISRLEELVPGITKQINLVKIFEDAEAATGQKVGTYTRGAISGGGAAIAGGVIGGPAGAILGGVAGLVASHPSLGIYLIAKYGQTLNISKQFLQTLIEKATAGKALSSTETRVMSGIVNEANRSLGVNPNAINKK